MQQIKNREYEGERPLFAMHDLQLENVQLPNALETFRHCRNVKLKNVQIDKADYFFMHGEIILNESCKASANCELRLWDERNCFSA